LRKDQEYEGFLSDIWACGITLYYFLHGKVPFYELNLVKLRAKIKNDTISFKEQLPEALKDCISKCLEKDPKKRIKLQELMVFICFFIYFFHYFIIVRKFLFICMLIWSFIAFFIKESPLGDK